jgi:hypothetical protein
VDRLFIKELKIIGAFTTQSFMDFVAVFLVLSEFAFFTQLPVQGE